MKVAHAARGGDLREVRDQHGRQPAALHLVGDRERDLGPVGPLELEDRVRDDALLGAGGDDQPVALGPVAGARRARAALSRFTPSEKNRSQRELSLSPSRNVAQRGRVRGHDRPHARGRAVAQRDVDVGGDGRAHSPTASRSDVAARSARVGGRAARSRRVTRARSPRAPRRRRARAC